MKWKEALNEATDAWSRTHPGSEEKAALKHVQEVVRDVNEFFGINLIEPTHEHMLEINRQIGDVEPEMTIQELTSLWNDLKP